MKPLSIGLGLLIALIAGIAVADSGLQSRELVGSEIVDTVALENGDVVAVSLENFGGWRYRFQYVKFADGSGPIEASETLADKPERTLVTVCGGFVQVTAQVRGRLKLYTWELPNPTHKLYLPLVCGPCAQD